MPVSESAEPKDIYNALLYDNPPSLFPEHDPRVRAIVSKNSFWLKKLEIDYPTWQVPIGIYSDARVEYRKASIQSIKERGGSRFIKADNKRMGVWHNYTLDRYTAIGNSKWRVLFRPCDVDGSIDRSRDGIWCIFKRCWDDFDSTRWIAKYYSWRVKDPELVRGVADEDGLRMTGKTMKAVWAKNPMVMNVDQLAYIVPNDPAVALCKKQKPDILFKTMNDDWSFLSPSTTQSRVSSHIVIGGEVDSFCTS